MSRGAAALRARAGDLREDARPRASLDGDEPQQPRLAASGQGDYAGARPLYERALAIYEKALGPEHPNTNVARRNLARLLLDSGNADVALSLGEVALAAHEKLLGQNHPWTKASAERHRRCARRARPGGGGRGAACALWPRRQGASVSVTGPAGRCLSACCKSHGITVSPHPEEGLKGRLEGRGRAPKRNLFILRDARSEAPQDEGEDLSRL